MATAVIILGGLLTACLGQDFLNAPLELDGFDHGWLVNVEPDEQFGVDLVANPLYPDVQWQLAEIRSLVDGIRRLGAHHHQLPTN